LGVEPDEDKVLKAVARVVDVVVVGSRPSMVAVVVVNFECVVVVVVFGDSMVVVVVVVVTFLVVDSNVTANKTNMFIRY